MRLVDDEHPERAGLAVVNAPDPRKRFEYLVFDIVPVSLPS
jgi:hypothetical protein